MGEQAFGQRFQPVPNSFPNPFSEPDYSPSPRDAPKELNQLAWKDFFSSINPAAHPPAKRRALSDRADVADCWLGAPRRALYDKRTKQYEGFRLHDGYDFDAAIGTRANAVLPGKVVFAGNADKTQHGLTVIIQSTVDGETVTSVYAHLSALSVKAGAVVAAGDKIGGVGDSGAAKGGAPHLHLTVLQNATARVNGGALAYFGNDGKALPVKYYTNKTPGYKQVYAQHADFKKNDWLVQETVTPPGWEKSGAKVVNLYHWAKVQGGEVVFPIGEPPAPVAFPPAGIPLARR